MDIITILIKIIFITFSIGYFDTYIVPLRARWYVLHTIMNFAIVVFSSIDLYTCFLYPSLAFTTEWNSDIPFLIAYIGHLYHLFIFKDLKKSDYVHHILMGPICGTFTIFYLRNPGANYIMFWMTGLPGGIDYLLLSLVKLNYVSRIIEKNINLVLQTWFRMPFLLIIGGLYYEQLFRENGPLPITIIAALLTLWNAIYYAQHTIHSYNKHILYYG